MPTLTTACARQRQIRMFCEFSFVVLGSRGKAGLKSNAPIRHMCEDLHCYFQLDRRLSHWWWQSRSIRCHVDAITVASKDTIGFRLRTRPLERVDDLSWSWFRCATSSTLLGCTEIALLLCVFRGAGNPRGKNTHAREWEPFGTQSPPIRLFLCFSFSFLS